MLGAHSEADITQLLFLRPQREKNTQDFSNLCHFKLQRVPQKGGGRSTLQQAAKTTPETGNDHNMQPEASY